MRYDQLEHAIRAACDVPIEVAMLPEGWSERTITVSHPVGTRGCKGLCIESHDLAASKLVAYRENKERCQA